MKQFLLACSCALSLMATTHPAQSAGSGGSVAIDKDFGMYTITWDPRGTTLVRWEVYNNDGLIAICGGYSSAGGSLAYELTEMAMKDARIKLNGEVIARNLTFFSKLKNQKQKVEHVGDPANCIVTDVPSPKGKAEFELYFVKDTYRY